MRTQIVIKSVNIVVDDFCDFSKIFKEKVISRLTEEVNEVVVVDQTVATTGNSESISSEPVATLNKSETKLGNLITTKKNQKHDSSGSMEVSLDVLSDLIRKE